MFVYRINKREFIKDLNGTGAGLFGARWNPRGMNMLYTSGSVSLASLEYLVHNYHILSRNNVALAKIEINTDSINELSKKDLPKDWNENTYTPQSTQQIGASFLSRAEHYILKVPSAIVPMEFNYLLNPLHPEHRSTVVKEIIDPFEIDDRLFSQQ